uniref:Uncharacterized protein n=1 Tax=Pyrodinium bahamense TaxID=73915 RepID=A0A7S0FEL6_9DINO|mmetsp:Transcript_25885/g.71223  ORF Transcript_25885/g.71223 Transcript_25885/m.71223 type:complete len:685 (+) Transcript_25885:61-2115(+)
MITRQDHGETNPLMPGNDSQDTRGQISHKGSVYTMMLFMPPLAHRMYGHYWTVEVPLALALFVMSVTLQLCLTLIAGTHIVQEQEDMRATLVRHENLTESYVAVMWDTLEYLGPKGVDLRKRAQQELLLGGNFSQDYRSENYTCCRGAACAGTEQCCPSLDVAQIRVPTLNHTRWGSVAHQLESFMLAMKKPGKASTSKDASKQEGDDAGGSTALLLPVCIVTGGIMSCMPPSVLVEGAWDQLDLNGDGKWSLAEAGEDPANFGCRIGVHLEDVFRAACRGLVKDAADNLASGWFGVPLPRSVMRRTAIPRAYFEVWRGILALCVHTDTAQCGDIISRGTFDGALSSKSNGTRGGMVDLDTAMAYCERLLTPGGICDNALPGSYVMYRSRIKEKCGVANPVTGPRHVNPHNPHDVSSIVSARWSNVESVEKMHSVEWRFFMALILVLWYVNLVDELKDIIHLLDFLHNFPVVDQWPFLPPTLSQSLSNWRNMKSMSLPSIASPDKDAEGGRKSADSIKIDSISRPHQLTVVCMAIIRSTLLVYLAFAGTYFLLSNQTFVDLLLNALALAFVFELDEFLYAFLIPEETKASLDNVTPLDYASSLPKSGPLSWLFAKPTWGLLLIPALTWVIVQINDYRTTFPTMQALQCACQQLGESCLAGRMFPRSWWDQYWGKMVLLRERGEL